MTTPILSILTPAVPSRLTLSRGDELWHDGEIEELVGKIGEQIGTLHVEHLILLDNKRRTVGEKRDALLRIARGKYVAFVDDDDDVSSDYVSEILKAAQQDPDVITFQQSATVNGAEALIEFRLGNPNEPFHGTTPEQHIRPWVKRSPWHVCAWRRMLALQSHFPAINYGEDQAFCEPLWRLPNLLAVHIPKVLHFYRHSSKMTEAPAKA